MERGKKSRLLVWLAIAVLLAAAILWTARPQPRGPRLVATVAVENREVVTLDLEEAEDQEFTILDETGLPITFQVREHAIRFLESNCPDKICVHTGFLKNDLDVASCLPNRTILFVTVVED